MVILHVRHGVARCCTQQSGDIYLNLAVDVAIADREVRANWCPLVLSTH